MRPMRLFRAATLATLLTTVACATNHRGEIRSDNPSTHGEMQMTQELNTLLDTYERGLNQGDASLIQAVYAEDAVFIGQPFPTATGRDEIVAMYAGFLSQLDFNVKFEVLEVEVDGTLGFIRTRSTGTIVPKGQTPSGPEQNREVFVVKKIDGAWKIYRYIFNLEVPAAR